MHRRFAAIAGTLAFALLVPLASVSADGPFTGQFLTADTETVCSDNLCTTASLSVFVRTGSTMDACLSVLHTNTELGGALYESEFGCAESFTFGKSRSGILLSIAATIHLDSDLGGSGRDVSVVGTFAMTSDIVGSPTIQTFADYPDPGCTTTWKIRERAADVSGTVAFGGTTFDADGVSHDYVFTERVRC